MLTRVSQARCATLGKHHPAVPAAYAAKAHNPQLGEPSSVIARPHHPVSWLPRGRCSNQSRLEQSEYSNPPSRIVSRLDADCGMNTRSANSPEPAPVGIWHGPSWPTVAGKYARRREWLTWPAHPYPLNSARIQCGRLQTNCRSGVLTANREVGIVSSPVRKTLPCLAAMTVAQAAGLGFRIACRGVAGGRRFPA
jgi:hypothetical protein